MHHQPLRSPIFPSNRDLPRPRGPTRQTSRLIPVLNDPTEESKTRPGAHEDEKAMGEPWSRELGCWVGQEMGKIVGNVGDVRSLLFKNPRGPKARTWLRARLLNRLYV